MLRTLIILLMVLFCGPALAQDTEPGQPRIDALEQALSGEEPVVRSPQEGAGASSAASKGVGAEGGGSGDPGAATLRRVGPPDLVPEAPPPGVLTAEGRRSMQSAYKAYYDYRVTGFAHRAEVFRWQLFSSRLIFVLVIAIVIAGLYFSWMQFHHGLKTGDLDKETSLEASVASGIKVSSPVLGVIILALSLGFFYLYLLHVYPIAEIF
ncbi:MAG: hypothetical protein AAF638_13560 [Pseudomonadota bacterium]